MTASPPRASLRPTAAGDDATGPKRTGSGGSQSQSESASGSAALEGQDRPSPLGFCAREWARLPALHVGRPGSRPHSTALHLGDVRASRVACCRIDHVGGGPGQPVLDSWAHGQQADGAATAVADRAEADGRGKAGQRRFQATPTCRASCVVCTHLLLAGSSCWAGSRFSPQIRSPEFPTLGRA